MDQMHSLLKRQLKRYFGDQFRIPGDWQEFIHAVNDAYRESDMDRGMLERSLELSSQELIQANSEVRAIFQAIPDLLFRLDSEGRILNYKAGATADLLIDPKELLGKRIQDVPLKQVSEKFREAIQQVQESKTIISVEYSLSLQDQPIFFEARLVPLPEDQIVVIIRNITKRKQAEEALKQAAKRFNLVTLATQDAIFDWDIVTHTIWRNENYQRIFGAAERCIDTDDWWNNRIHPEDRELVNNVQSLALKGDANIISMEYRLRRLDGSYAFVVDRSHIVRDNKGQAIRMIGALNDITERKQAEEKIHKLNEELELRVIERTVQLEAANKELEAFAYSASHDLRTPLRAIDGYTNILLEDYTQFLDEEGKRICDIISNETKRMSRLIDDLLSFSHISHTEMQISSINMEVLPYSVFYELTTPEDRERIEFRVASLPPANGDPTLIREVWMSLISNAVKFSSKRERAVIEVGFQQTGQKTIYFVRDNGAGFDMQYSNKLFGVFQRLHGEKEFEGSGVGLAIVQRLIHRHGGEIWAESQVDKGATFFFTLGK
jgi:PAS domain S-box-containing protein